MEPGKRVRSVNDGQLGFVEQDGEDLMVRLDRPSGAGGRVPYNPALWVEDVVPKLTDMARAAICYAADRAYREQRGEYNVPDWRALGDSGRARVLEGPKKAKDPFRMKLWNAVKSMLEGV